MSISAEKVQDLRVFLSNLSFTVPDYQRGYEWQKSNVLDFHASLMECIKSGHKKFIGTFILKKEHDDDETAEVVDGQQRLTTIFIYVGALRDLFDSLAAEQLPTTGIATIKIDPKAEAERINNDKLNLYYRFIPNALIKNLYLTYVAPDPKNPKVRPALPTKDKKYTRNFRSAVRTIRELLATETKDAHSDLQKLSTYYEIFKALLDKLQVLAITSNDTFEALDIFMTMNTKGLNLGASDIVKGMIFQAILRGKSGTELSVRSDALLVEWQTIMENLDEGDLDQALRHFFLGRSTKSFQIPAIITKAEATIKDTTLTEESNATQLLADIFKMSEVYREILSPDLMVVGKENLLINEAILCLNKINSSYRILMLALQNPTVKSPSTTAGELLLITRHIESLVQRWQITGGNAQELEDFFRSLAFAFNEGTTFTKQLCTELFTKMPVDADVLTELTKPVSDASNSRVILFRIHQFLGDKSRFLPYDTSKTDVEHIAPKSPTSDWILSLGKKSSSEGIDDPTSYEYLIEKIGNKTLLEEHINNQLKQKDFSEKSNGVEETIKAKTYKFPGYKNSAVEMTKDLAKVKVWDEAIINSRTDWVADCFVKIFSAEIEPSGLVTFADWIK